MGSLTALHAAENGSVFGPHAPDLLQGVCVSSTPLYCRSASGSASLHGAPCGEEEQHSVDSQDSGIPTLELSSPDVTEESHSTEPLSLRRQDAPATLKLETIGEGGASSQVRGRALSYRDSTSVCSTSSLSTDFSATLSLGNDDIAGDFVVTSDSSAVVDFHDFNDFSRFPQTPPINSVHRDHPLQHHDEVAAKKESPIVNFFNRSLFSKKVRDAGDPNAHSEPSWRLFGRNSLRQTQRVLKENEKAGGSASPRQSVRKHLEFEPLSTTALILEHRPANLPAKPAEEAQKHKQQYEEMVAQAKKRELKEAQKKRRQLEERVRLEESIGNAALTWSQEILPNWHNVRSSKRVRDLWWQGIPPSVRGRVWSLAIGNELNITHGENLPAKPAEEAQKHKQQYEEMVAQAKKRELKEAQKKRRQLEERVRLEESIGNAALTWSQEILPNWHNVRSSKRVRDLWWQGIPPSVRGRVWSLAIGNELNITHELYDICLARAKEKWSAAPSSITTTENDTGDAGSSQADREASLELIKLDISRTFPSLCIFQKGGPYHDVLHSILGAYTCYRPDVGYMLTYFAAFEVFFEENLPKLFAHFKSNNLTPDIYLIDWIFTLYSKSLPLDIACRVWDVFCRDGEEFLFRTALGILRFYGDVLTHMDFIHMAQFLTRLPEQISTHTQSHTLFSCISSINMSCRNRTWTQVLQALQKETEHSSPVLKH
ncbi:hypothetical protein PGIGA_G00198020 [Pangasianodon gigas]|uniref:Uncharacterized protein n=1 Tax=Pangasianodon gigas TaxID=30993 RepID=A0ACC5WEE0_PANGG|nr:hypothetical protein [Pangasianodon gigas]